MKRITRIASLLCVAWLAVASAGCGSSPKPYGQERQLFLPGARRLVWAVAPTVNLSGESRVDPLLQSDVVYKQLQEVHGLTVIPVDRVAEVYVRLRIDKVQSEQDAATVCDLLGCDALVVPTVTMFDPYDPPKLGASLQLFAKPGTVGRAPLIDPHELQRSPSPMPQQAMVRPRDMVQAVGMFDAANGSVRERAASYVAGRMDPNAPIGYRAIYLDMDRFCGFAYHELLTRLLEELAASQPPQ